MKIEIISEKNNPLTQTRQLWVGVEHPGKQTPNRHDILPEMVRQLGSDSGLTVIDKIFSEKGVAKSRVKVLIFSDKAAIPENRLARQERKVKKFIEKRAKKTGGEEKPAETAAAAASPEKKADVEEGKE